MQQFETVYIGGQAVTDRVEVTGEGVPEGRWVFMGSPRLPIVQFYSAGPRGPLVTVDTGGYCWATYELDDLQLVVDRCLYRVDLDLLFSMATVAKLTVLVELLEIHFGRANPYQACPTCGVVVRRDRIV